MIAASPSPKTDPRVRAFRLVYLVAGAQFALPALSYAVAPHLAEESLDQLNRLLGGGAWPHLGMGGQPWHMLAVGNVATLAFLCFLIQSDLARWWAAVPALLFLKGFSALYSIVLAAQLRLPAFLGIFALDGEPSAATSALRSTPARGTLPAPR